MKIIKTPNSILGKKAKPIKKIDKNIRRIIQKMKKTLANVSIGVGLAAPQIGFSWQIFIIAYPPSQLAKARPWQAKVFINPEIKWKSKEKILDTKNQKPTRNATQLQASSPPATNLEGCLSIPNVWGKVKRAKEVKVKYLDEKGKMHKRKFKGFTATIIQHEIDHLKGVLFTEHVLAQNSKLYKQVKDKETKETIMKEIKL